MLGKWTPRSILPIHPTVTPICFARVSWEISLIRRKYLICLPIKTASNNCLGRFVRAWFMASKTDCSTTKKSTSIGMFAPYLYADT